MSGGIDDVFGTESGCVASGVHEAWVLAGPGNSKHDTMVTHLLHHNITQT